MATSQLTPQMIYQYDTHRNIPWNIVEYSPLKEYLGEVTKPDYQNRYLTKRGYYLDRHIKVVKDLPPPCQYEVSSSFDQTQNIKDSKKVKIDFKLKKHTYLDQIQSHAKHVKTPAVGDYDLHQVQRKSSVKKKKFSIEEKRFFYQDNQFLSTTLPGSAFYYPHDQINHIKTDRTTHKLWIEKHNRQDKLYRKRKSLQPAPGTYKPLSIQHETFDQIQVHSERELKKKSKKKSKTGFGSSDTKFQYNRESKVKIKETRPDPCKYQTMIQWKGKGLDQKKNNWVRCVSAGPSRNVYH